MEISVETSQNIANEVIAAAGRRQPPLPPSQAPKVPQPFNQFPPQQSVQIRAIDLLRKIGELTTPSTVNLASLSASWATRRYFWAIDDPTNQRRGQHFRLSQDARGIERHQKTLLSDEFGMGFAGLLVERLLSTNRFIDMDFALADPQQYFDVQHVGPRRPDFLLWGTNTPVYVVECKGSQTNWNCVVSQLRRGMEQLPSINIPGYTSVALVVATYLDRSRTRVIFLDPPNEEDDEPLTDKREWLSESTPEKIGPREWQVKDPKAFFEKMNIGTNLTLLRWAAQHSTAREFESRLDILPNPVQYPNAELETEETQFGDFLGVSIPLAPEIGINGPSLFRGLRREALIQLQHGELEEAMTPEISVTQPDDPRMSIGSSGTCLILRDLDI
ncbi:MAG TPA: hypothetical protein VGW12_20080 [Pyrinomonadaceae bacterium]|nr:hypothetical protein [Pyrinomonadaceae bacterium]